MHGFGFDGWHMLWGGWWMLLFWIGVIALGIWGGRWLIAGPRPAAENHHSLTARETAAGRYARGELSRDEFLALVNDLESHDDLSNKSKRSEY
jgi:uncharacterized membrane protein